MVNPSMLYITRPPVTDDEAAILEKLALALEASHSSYCTGTFTPETESPCLLYTCQSSNLEARACPLKNATEKDLEELHSQCAPSSFGRGKELVHDESYRLAKELPTSRFNLNFDPLSNQHGVVAAISAFMRFLPGVDVRMYKLNSYGVGGHFKAHQDTPKGKAHIGTLLIGLPSPYTGGQLLLRDSMKQTTTIDWSTDGRNDDGSYPWVFFFSDTEHEILPVKSGYRLTLAFDVFATHDVRYQFPVSKFNIDVEPSTIYKELSAALKNNEFLTGGGRLAFGLSHEYPASEMGPQKVPSPGLLSILKGSDMILWQTFRALGLKIEIRAAYQAIDFDETDLDGSGDHEDEEDSEGGSNRYPVDNFSCFLKESEWGWQVMLTSESFEGVDKDSSEGEYGDSLYRLLVDDAEAKLERDLVWARRPLHFSHASTFASYGNEPSVGHSYVAGVLIATIPAAGLDGRI